MDTLTCPFCEFVEQDEYFLLQHVELVHPENGESPFIVTDQDAAESRSSLGHQQAYQGWEVAARYERKPSSSTSGTESPAKHTESTLRYVDCPYECGELVASLELVSHTDLHLAENMAFEEEALAPAEFTTEPYNDDRIFQEVSSQFSSTIHQALRPEQNAPRAGVTRKTSLKELLFGTPPRRTSAKRPSNTTKRLGRAELGPYAHEKQMPPWLRHMLEEGAKVSIYNRINPDGTIVRVEVVANETPDLVPVLARLSYQDPTVDHAFYCRPEVHHIAKMSGEGGFCGYRNIQMMISQIRGARARGHEYFPGKAPSILKIQEMIEHAWDMGFNSTGKIETGGILLTRKYIGTPEAQALFNSLSIPCEAHAFSRSGNLAAHERLLLAVGEYFNSDVDVVHTDQKLHLTSRPPIYFQHHGHSMTIVGIEVRSSGALNLVVFDPMFHPSPAIKKLVGSNSFCSPHPDTLLRAHRRGESYLSKYNDFELLTCTDSSEAAR